MNGYHFKIFMSWLVEMVDWMTKILNHNPRLLICLNGKEMFVMCFNTGNEQVKSTGMVILIIALLNEIF